MHFLLTVVNNRHRDTNFFSKIERILLLFKDELTKLKNDEIFQLFRSNKRILLFLIEEEILQVDEYFVKQITNGKYSEKKYPQYFAPEIQPFINKVWFPKYDPNDECLKENVWVEDIKKKIADDFHKNRKIGENESYISELIRRDAVEEFVAYVNKACIKRDATIAPSIYETNAFLNKKQTLRSGGIGLIEYAAFFGLIQIFTFLKNEGVELTPSLWPYAIHGKNAELIHLLENNNVKPTVNEEDEEDEEDEEESDKECIQESIKCHHNKIVDYFFNNSLQNEYENSKSTFIQSLKYYNFRFLQKEFMNETSFWQLCHYDYYSVVKFLLISRDIDIYC